MSRHSFLSRISTTTRAFTRDLVNLLKTRLGMAWLMVSLAATVFIVAVTSMTFAPVTVQAPVMDVFDSILFVWVIVMAAITAGLVAALSVVLVMRYQRSHGNGRS